MHTTARPVRTGLDTSTGDRSAARMAGRMTPNNPVGSTANPVAGAQTVEQLFQGMVDKQNEKERVATAYQKNKDLYESGTPAPLNSAGSQTIADANAARTLDNTTKTLNVVNQGYANRESINLGNEQAKKAFGLGQYSGTQGGVVTDVTNKGTQWLAQMAADTNASRTWELQQKAANTARAQVDGQNQAATDAAYSQRYAAAQSADAQKTAAAYQMFGQIAGQGQYKYWGGN